MKPTKLYIENFMCHDKSFIDFSEFSSALILGYQENNDLHANGVGKTTIFKAIEYVLFNQSDVNLEKVIRDDTDICQVVLDFLIGDQEYRIARKRTRKGASDLTFLQRKNVAGKDTEIYHKLLMIDGEEIPYPLLDKDTIDKYWKDLSGSRTGDTEKDLAKLIKINPKSFRSTIHFVQNDFTGLSTSTPEKRKGILKDAFNLIIYTKLEKLAKDKSSLISKDIDKYNTLLSALGNPALEIDKLKEQLCSAEQELTSRLATLSSLNEALDIQNGKITDLNNQHSNLESKYANLLVQEKVLIGEKNRLEISVKEYQSKKSNAAKSAKEMINELPSMKKLQAQLAALDYSQVDILTETISQLKEKITICNVNINNSLENYEDLKIPLPSGSACKTCRKPMTDQDRQVHKEHISQEMKDYVRIIQDNKTTLSQLNTEIIAHQQVINRLSLSKQQLESLNTKITSKNKEILDKKSLYEEYQLLFNKFTSELEIKNEELAALATELANSSVGEANNIQKQITLEKQVLATISSNVLSLNKEVTYYNSSKAVIEHSLSQKTNDHLKVLELNRVLTNLNAKYSMYPSVTQAFSSTGIPNLIIQNVLDDLQIEANTLLAQLKPGLQLSFFVEKKVEKTGDQADTLDINYQINGRNRYYEQLSGAQQLAVTFSLKLGLSFLLQKMIGADLKLLLLDEIDQSLDKASVDALADIVKFFQKDFTILVITHNDRMKDKFPHAIMVSQDGNMVSRAKVVSF